MKAFFDLLLGVVTSIGGFVEIGSISTSAQAGSEFGYQLLWAVAIATLMLAMLFEMSGRLAAVRKRPLAAAIRERFGVLLAAEIGGVAIAIKLISGVGMIWTVLPIAVAVWLVLWFCGFGIIEYGIGLLGLVTTCFVVAA
jgi:Mn2+/Fe2+ NRAMP family transporter